MAGLDDYQFYTNLKEKDSPFWQKLDKSTTESQDAYSISSERPSNFPRQLGISQAGSEPLLKTESMSSLDNLDKHKDLQFEKYGDVSITLISICSENLLSHPFIVLRRQCQVNVSSQRYHVQPFTLFPALLHIQNQQGLGALWKGIGSILTIRGVTLAIEDFLSKFTPWPKEISPHSSMKTIGQHLLLKCSAVALITPFYSASLVETVQSEITSEKPGILDVFKEGIFRLMSFTQPQTGRMLPVWLLVLPTVVHGVVLYIIANIVSTLASKYLRNRQKRDRTGAISRDTATSEASIRLQSAYIGHFAADVVLYPLETILHRLHLQGTRTIIDSLDVGYEVKPILTRYEGFFDCVGTSIREEGFFSLFKGFGALCLQYAVYGTVLKFVHIIIKEVTALLSPSKPKEKIQDASGSKSSTFGFPFMFEDRMAPLTQGAPYTSLHSGVSSLHSSPLHSSRRGGYQENKLYHSGSVDLAELSYMDTDSSSSFRRYGNDDTNFKDDEIRSRDEHRRFRDDNRS